MTKDTIILLNLVSQAAGLLSVVLLYMNSIGVPWDKQTWKGASTFEQKRYRRQLVCAWIGIPCAIMAVGCQTVITLWGP